MESWGKPQRSLALKGRRLEEVDDMIEAVVQATLLWKQHRSPYVRKKAA